jgi:hypothetical protein
VSTSQERVWPTKEEDLRLSRIDAQRIARRRKARKRKDRIRLTFWAVGIALWLGLTLWVAFGR